MHCETKAFLAFLQFAQRPAPGIPIRHLLEGALDHGNQAGQTVFEYVVDGTLAQRLDGALFAYGAGNEDERCVGTSLPRDVQRQRTIEFRQRVVGQNEVGRERVERLQICGLALHTACDDGQAAAAHFGEQKLRVLDAVFDHQDADAGLGLGGGHDSGMPYEGRRFMTAQYRPAWETTSVNVEKFTGFTR